MRLIDTGSYNYGLFVCGVQPWNTDLLKCYFWERCMRGVYRRLDDAVHRHPSASADSYTLWREPHGKYQVPLHWHVFIIIKGF